MRTHANVELLMLPYSGRRRTLVGLLIQELRGSKWTEFKAAVAFAKQSGNYRELLDALVRFAEKGGSITLTFGADTFGGDARGSEYEAVGTLLERLDRYPRASLYLYRERRRTFHPKLYAFINRTRGRAMLIIGSSNWSAGGFHSNVEANVIVRLDLSKRAHRLFLATIDRYFDEYWREPRAP